MSGFSLICCVVNMGEASRTIKYAKKYGVRGGTVSIGTGTVHSRLLDFLNINEARKEIVSMIVEDELASAAIRGISDDMRFDRPHRGIAFSCSVSEFTGSRNTIGRHTKNEEVKNNVYKAIYTVVDKGRGMEVIDAANKAGARGGTIINARGSGIHETMKLFSVEIEPEKDEVFIIAQTELKDRIVESIKDNIKISEPGNGVMFVIDVNEAYGLR